MTMAGAEPNVDSLVEVLKEIRDELRAVRTELGSRTARMTSGIRTEVVDRAARWRNAALAGGGLALLAIVLGVAMRERSAPAIVAVAPQGSATPVGTSATLTAMPPAAATAGEAPVALAAPATLPTEKSPPPLAVKPTAATKQAARWPAATPAAIASVPVPLKNRVKPDVAARPPSEVAADEDEALAFSPPPRRVRAHRISYGPVESEPAKL
jgi:hypothetical protein